MAFAVFCDSLFLFTSHRLKLLPYWLLVSPGFNKASQYHYITFFCTSKYLIRQLHFNNFTFTNRGELDMDIKKHFLTLLAVMFAIPVTALAKPDVVVNTVAEKIVVETVQGKQVKKQVPATNADPGQVLVFTLNYQNKGNEKAINVKVDNPIPNNSVYVVGSGFGKNSKMIFSIDGGKTYKAPSLLTYEETLANGKKVKRQASPEQYTHVRWVINEIPAGTSGSVGFQVRIK